MFPDAIFEKVFVKILELCISKVMVSGHTQVIDSAPVKANASMDSLELKVPASDLEDYLHEIRNINQKDKCSKNKVKHNKASEEDYIISVGKQELQEIKSRTEKWKKDQTSTLVQEIKEASIPAIKHTTVQVIQTLT